MGEVRAQVTLTNGFDLVKAEIGEMPWSEVRSYVADAMVDTGAVRLILPQFVCDRLGVLQRGRQVGEFADGRNESVPVTYSVLVDIEGRTTMDEALVLGDEVLIGQTVLEKTDLLVDCARHRLVPNPAHPDQPVSKVK
jgi:predicted aspartyl protease